ncbi:sorbosone dehydrogenase family protein [Pseudoruegeria sp. SK021]|uniref:PQQ-dependent sugar dehydrogenase n=1 Tax=Pseudoruegeria sp. SK021 TaxID=1933035 RepID=UPI000A218491|nr:PQQ-dependent sugar dehydrogenase [Pseudoruegeria sp. SK021]OSP55881.1 sorbosone dehydrogenase [Pseudoruegeria sp. SK021]
MTRYAAILALGAALAAEALTPPVFAQNAPRFTEVEQGGRSAARLRATLDRIALPEGFQIALYALVPDARHMAVSPDGSVIFVGTRKDKVWAVRDTNGDHVADRVTDLAPGLALRIPNGPCMAPNGDLYVAEQNRVLRFPNAAVAATEPRPTAYAVVPQGGLIPDAEESYNHGARVCKIGPDGRIYISLGQPFNVPPADKLDLYDQWGIGGIIRMQRDGTRREVFTRGIRNSVGHDFHPATGELWFTDNQVDGMGDTLPPGEINRQTKPGQHFGFPWYGGGATRTAQYAKAQIPAGVVFPAVETTAHAADLGMTFYTGSMFPRRYRHAIFSAQHGSWNRSTPVGARVMVTLIGNDGSAQTTPFAEGWIAANGSYLGRPVDVAQLPDGSLLVSDDKAGALYRISYQGR